MTENVEEYDWDDLTLLNEFNISTKENENGKEDDQIFALSTMPSTSKIVEPKTTDENIFLQMAKKKLNCENHERKKPNERTKTKGKKSVKKTSSKFFSEFNLTDFNVIIKEEEEITLKFKQNLTESQNSYKIYMEHMKQTQKNYKELLKIIKRKHIFMTHFKEL